MTTVKIVFRGDIRRVTVSDFASLVASVGLAYKIEDFVIKYLDDDGDRVSIAGAEEFEEVVKAANGKKVLKLLIFVPKSLQERKEAAESNNSNSKEDGCCGKEEEEEGYPSLSSASAPPPSAPPLDPLDHGMNCNACGVRIIGTRYQCTVCACVSVCGACEERNAHDSAHTLMKIRVPISAKCNKMRGERVRAQKWGGCCKWKKFRCLALPLIFIAILRHLPFFLCLLGLWAGCKFMEKRRAALRVCSECNHKENCRVGKKAKKLTQGNCCGLVPKICLFLVCLVVRALPCWLLFVCIPIAMCVCRRLRRLKKGCNAGLRGNMGAMCGQYKDILQMSWPQLLNRVQQNQAPRGGLPKSVMGCAAVAASESLAASVAAVVALSESVAANLGVSIPVAVPVNATPYTQQIQMLKEMGFEETPVIQQLLVKHSGNIQAVISDFMQLKPKQN